MAGLAAALALSGCLMIAAPRLVTRGGVEAVAGAGVSHLCNFKIKKAPRKISKTQKGRPQKSSKSKKAASKNPAQKQKALPSD